MHVVDGKKIYPHVLQGLTPAVWITGLLLSLWLRILVPPFLSPAAADDGLMVNQANAILRGEWLGQWNFLTLAKAPGYAIFASVSGLVGIPVTVGVHILYLVGVVLAAVLIRQAFSSQLGTITLLVLAFNPVMFGTEASRIYRDALITALILITVSLSGLLGLQLLNSLPKRRNWGLAGTLGLSLGFLFITKMDTILYTVPAAALVFLSAVFVSGRTASSSRPQLRAILELAVPGLVGLALSPLIVVGMNAHHYNLPVIEDTLNGPIPALTTALASIDTGQNAQFVAVSASQRQRAYDVSPSASRMKPFLDPDTVEASRSIEPCTDAGICHTYAAPPTWKVGLWRDLSCSSIDVCDEASTWFLWNLRDALMLASDTDSASFYELAESATAEINSACATERLTCTSALIPTLGNSGDTRLPPLDSAILPTLIESLRFSGADQTRPNVGLPATSPEEWELWATITPWYPKTENQLSPSEATRTLVTILQKTYALAALMLLVPSILGILLSFFGISRRPQLALMACGFATGWLLQVSMLAFLEVNQGNYISEAGKYLLNTSSLLLVFLMTSTWLLVCALRSYFAVDATSDVRQDTGDSRV